MSHVERKRRNLFIQRAFQGRFIAWVIGLLVLAGLCSAMIMYLLLSSEIGSELQAAHPRINQVGERLVISILFGNGLAIVIAGLSASVVVLYISHKIAGPLFRFERLCGEVGRGNLQGSASLRESDQLQGLADAFGDMLEQLRSRAGQERAAFERLGTLMEQLREGNSGDQVASDVLTEIDHQLKVLDQSIPPAEG